MPRRARLLRGRSTGFAAGPSGSWNRTSARAMTRRRRAPATASTSGSRRTGPTAAPPPARAAAPPVRARPCRGRGLVRDRVLGHTASAATGLGHRGRRGLVRVACSQPPRPGGGSSACAAAAPPRPPAGRGTGPWPRESSAARVAGPGLHLEAAAARQRGSTACLLQARAAAARAEVLQMHLESPMDRGRDPW